MRRVTGLAERPRGAALYLLAPQGFAVHGAHLEPALDEEIWRQRLVKAINATPAR